VQELIDQVNGLWLEVVGELQLTVSNFLENFLLMLTIERHITYSHLVDDAAKRPQVSGWARPIIIQHFRSYVQRRSDKGATWQAMLPRVLLKE